MYLYKLLDVNCLKRDVNTVLNRVGSMRSVLLWDITRLRVVIVYRRFGTTYQSRLQGSRAELQGGEGLASRPGCFNTGEKAQRYRLNRSLDGPQSRSGSNKIELSIRIWQEDSPIIYQNELRAIKL
jgi:hypothetical protein